MHHTYNPIIRQLWKVYAWFFMLLAIAGNVCLFFGYPFRSPFASLSLMNILQTAITSMSLVPLFLFVYQKRFLSSAFWKFFFFLFVLFELKDIRLADFGVKSGLFPFVGFIITLPSYFAIYFYAFCFFGSEIAPGKNVVGGGREKGSDCVCIYATNNEHDAQLIKIGLEGEGIEVFFQRKSDVEAPNSFIHELELFVLERDKDKSIKLLSKFKQKFL